MFNTFVPTYVLSLCTARGKNKINICDIEGFVPVANLNGAVGFPSSFIKSFIGRTGKLYAICSLSVYLKACTKVTEGTLDVIIIY